MTIDPPAEQSGTPSASYTPTQAVLLDIWRKILWVPDVGLNDNFIDLGGHSLAATRCINRIRLMFHVEVPVDAFFVDPADVATIADLIDRARLDAPAPQPRG
jgi:acyl carrier protein